VIEQQKMVRISMEVRSGASRFRVGVQAQSIRKALSMVGGGYPHGEVKVLFPIDPEDFFVHEPSAPTVVVGHEHIYREAA
jgi:hypothetical protein